MSDQDPPADRPLPPQGGSPQGTPPGNPPPPGQPGAPGEQWQEPGQYPPGGQYQQAGQFPPGGQYQQGGVVPQSIGGPFYSTGLVILLTIVTCGIWGAVWSYRTGEDLKQYNNDGFGGVLNLIIFILLSPILMFTIPMEIEKMYQRDGRESPVSPLLGLWLLLPLIGNIIWYVKVQAALNDFWLSKGAQAA
jgi:hypothetical protein